MKTKNQEKEKLKKICENKNQGKEKLKKDVRIKRYF